MGISGEKLCDAVPGPPGPDGPPGHPGQSDGETTETLQENGGTPGGD